MTYGERLREMRAERRLSLRQVEERGGPNKDTMSLIERDVHRPHPQTLGRIAQALEMSVAELRAELEAAESPLGVAPPSAEQRSFNNHLLEEARRAQWDAAVRNARRLREHGRTRMEGLLSAWRESKERGEAKDARRDYLDEMGGLLDDALDARSALQKNASVPALEGIPLGKIPIPEFEEIAEADSLYWSLRNMVRGAGYLSIHPKRKPDREVHEVAEAA